MNNRTFTCEVVYSCTTPMCKLFVDIDCGDSNVIIDIQSVIEDLRSIIQNYTNQHNHILEVVYTQCSSMQQKYHVICNVVTDQYTAKELITQLHNNQYYKYVDLSVYSKNRLFRLPYAYKVSRDTQSKLHVDQRYYDCELQDYYKYCLSITENCLIIDKNLMLIRQPVIKQTHCDIDIEKIKQLLPNIKTKEQANNTIYIEYINNQKCLNGNVHKSNNAIVYIH